MLVYKSFLVSGRSYIEDLECYDFEEKYIFKFVYLK